MGMYMDQSWDGNRTLDKDPIKAGVDLGKSYMVDDINLAFEKGEEMVFLQCLCVSRRQ